MTETVTDRISLEEEIIRVTAENVERLPVLEAIFERHAQGLAAALKAFTGVATDAKIAKIEYVSCGEALTGTDKTWLAMVCEATPWKGPVALALDPNLLFSLLEVLLGGRSSRPIEWTPRGFTSIEKRLATQSCDIVLKELSTAFAPVSSVEFNVSYIESSPQAVMIAPAKAPCARITLDVSCEGRGGAFVFVLPYPALEPVKSKLSDAFMGEHIGQDAAWEARMKRALNGTDVTLSAILRELRLPLSEVLGWKPGQVIDLGIDMESEVTLAARGRTLLRGAVGRRRTGAAAIRITETRFTEDGDLS